MFNFPLRQTYCQPVLSAHSENHSAPISIHLLEEDILEVSGFCFNCIFFFFTQREVLLTFCEIILLGCLKDSCNRAEPIRRWYGNCHGNWLASSPPPQEDNICLYTHTTNQSAYLHHPPPQPPLSPFVTSPSVFGLFCKYCKVNFDIMTCFDISVTTND